MSGKQIEVEMIADNEFPMLLIPKGIYEFFDFSGKIIKITLVNDLLVDLMKVTFKQFQEFVKSGDYFDDSNWLNPDNRKVKTANQLFIERKCNPWEPYEPMKITWFEAMAFANWSGKRLLTEEEWMVFTAFTEGLLFNDRKGAKGVLWDKVRQSFDKICSNYKQSEFEKKFYPLSPPREWCINEQIIKGREITQSIPSIKKSLTVEPTKIFTFRCCRDLEARE